VTVTEPAVPAPAYVAPVQGRVRRIASWTLYDWANSAFTTIVVTFVYSTYFSSAFAPDANTGTDLWAWGVSISAVLVAVLSPVVGAMADRGGRRRSFLLISTLVCVAATALLAFVSPSMPNAVLVALTVFVVANVAFEVGGVFYNSFLPIIAPPGRIGTISGLGWGVGYTAGILSMLLALFAFVGLGEGAPWLGLSTEEGFNVRAVNLLVAGWFLVFSIPMFLFVRDPEPTRKGVRVGAAIVELRRTFGELGRYREMAKFLLARLIYNDGLGTIFAFGGIYAAGTFGMDFSEVIVFGIALNVVAGLGAFVFGFVDDRLGGKRTILVSVAALTCASALAVWAPDRTWLWIAGIGVGIFAGPNQAASRSLMGRFVPAHQQAEFFGFFAFSGKVTSFAGPFLLGRVTGILGSQRAGVATVILFFLLGGILLSLVKESDGIRAAREASPSPEGPPEAD
jgi:UMF1 family MFS transporter